MRLIFTAVFILFGLSGPFELRRVFHPAEVLMMPAGVWGVSSLNLIPPAQAAPRGSRWPGPFPVDVLEVKDGDTIDVRFRDGPCGRGPCPGAEMLIRVLGIDAPEAHRCSTKIKAASGGLSCAACPEEYALGRQALAFTKRFASEGDAARVSDIRPDKYGGRVVATFEVFRGGAWQSLGAALLTANLAVAYDGGKKTKPWCQKPRGRAHD